MGCCRRNNGGETRYDWKNRCPHSLTSPSVDEEQLVTQRNALIPVNLKNKKNKGRKPRNTRELNPSSATSVTRLRGRKNSSIMQKNALIYNVKNRREQNIR